MKSVFGCKLDILYLWVMESEVCNQVFSRAHIEPELSLKDHQIGHVGLDMLAWLQELKQELHYKYGEGLTYKN